MVFRPLLWQYDINTTNIWENSNIYSDGAAYSWTRAAAMLINDTVAGASNFTYTVRIRAADNDACGLIWGYQDEDNFYRVTFARQTDRTDWPFPGWDVDRMVNGAFTDLFGKGNTLEPYTEFIYTADRFFDVIVGMTNGLFSLTVVDDPTNAAPTVYKLVQSRVLPAAVAGKVGVFTWGQQVDVGDGLPSVGVRFHRVSLLPTPLAGTTNPLAPTWTSVVTPRGANGATNLTPIWALALNENGTTSRLREASGTYFSADNVAAYSTNFAAVSIVAGDALNWSNYVFSARCIPADDDGWGLLVRYTNPTNWYRIGFRRQDSAPGLQAGHVHSEVCERRVRSSDVGYQCLSLHLPQRQHARRHLCGGHRQPVAGAGGGQSHHGESHVLQLWALHGCESDQRQDRPVCLGATVHRL